MKKETSIKLPCHRINTKNLKTAWKRSESKLSFRQWCKLDSTLAWMFDLIGKLKKYYGKDWITLEGGREEFSVITEKAGKLTTGDGWIRS